MTASLSSRSTRLFMALTAFFVGNAVRGRVRGREDLRARDHARAWRRSAGTCSASGSLSFTAGVLIWPIVFIMTDVINEYFGRRGVRFISFAAAGMITYAFFFAYAAIHLAPADWWVTSMRAVACRTCRPPTATSSARACGRSAVRSSRSWSAS